MKKTKSIIIVLIILVILIIIAMLIISQLDKGKNVENNSVNNIVNNDISNNNVSEEEELKGEEQIDAPDKRVTEDNITILTDHNKFFSIENLISRYFLYLRAGNSEAAYDMIEESYKDENDINEQNVIEILRSGKPYNGSYTSKEVYQRKDNYKPIYFISGTLEKDEVKTPYYFVMKQDTINVSFTLKPITEEEYKMYLNERKTENFEEDIELNKYNKIVNTTFTQEQIAKKYFNSYIQNARNNPEEAYNSLDEDYRNARFGSYRKYQEYLAEPNKAKQLENLDPKGIKNITEFDNEEEYRDYMANLSKKSIKKYYYSNDSGKDYYVCVDDYDNHYIFEISGVMNYRLYLDTYTVDLDRIIDNEKTTASEKADRDVEKVFEALNTKDYEYVYKKMDEEIKQGDFRNYNEFEKYVNNELFDNNSMEFDDSRTENNMYAYKIKIKDNEGKHIEEILMIIEIELTQEDDFIIKGIGFTK